MKEETTVAVAWTLGELSHHPILFVLTLLVIVFIGIVVLWLPHLLTVWREIHNHPSVKKKAEEKKNPPSSQLTVETVTGMVENIKHFVEQEFVAHNLQTHRILFALLRVTLYSESSPLWERLCAGYEYFAMGGNHGAEQWVVEHIFMKYVEALGMWHSVLNHYRQLKLEVVDVDAQKALDYVTNAVDRLQRKVE